MARKSLPQYVSDDIIMFIIEKCEDIVSPLNMVQLHKEFNKLSGQSASYFVFNSAFSAYRLRIQYLDSLDKNAKVKQLFGLSVEIGEEFLKEIRKEAMVELDKFNRITKYYANDGSLKLVGKHDSVSKSFNSPANKNKNTAGCSNSSKRGNANTINQGSAEKKKKKTVQIPPQVESDDSVSDNDVERTEDVNDENDNPIDDAYISNQQIKLEPFDGPLKMDLTRGAVINDGDDFVEEIPAPTHSGPIEVKTGNNLQSGTRDNRSIHTVLEAAHVLIRTLNVQILTELQKKIEQKMKEMKNSTQSILDNEILNILELCLSKVSKNATWHCLEDKISLEKFLNHLRFIVIVLKSPILDGFEKKLDGIIEELQIQDKSVPLTIIRKALHTFYNNIIAL